MDKDWQVRAAKRDALRLQHEVELHELSARHYREKANLESSLDEHTQAAKYEARAVYEDTLASLARGRLKRKP